MEIRIAGRVNDSIVDGPGLRYTVFTQGCQHNCPGCHNPQTHSLSGGKLIAIDEIINEIKSNPLLSGVTLSGGEPFLQIPEILTLIKEIKALNLDIIIYSGYTFEELLEMHNPQVDEILYLSNYLIDGRFILNQRSLDLLFRGSKNQRIIDLQKSYKESRIIETDFNDY